RLQNRLAPQQTLQNGDVIDQLYRALAANVADPPGRVAGRSTAIPGQAPGRCLVQQPGDGFDYVIDAGEIPPVTAVIEQPDRPPFADGMGKQHRRHVGATPGTVYGKKPQAGAGNGVEMGK